MNEAAAAEPIDTAAKPIDTAADRHWSLQPTLWPSPDRVPTTESRPRPDDRVPTTESQPSPEGNTTNQEAQGEYHVGTFAIHRILHAWTTGLGPESHT